MNSLYSIGPELLLTQSCCFEVALVLPPGPAVHKGLIRPGNCCLGTGKRLVAPDGGYFSIRTES